MQITANPLGLFQWAVSYFDIAFHHPVVLSINLNQQ